MHYDALGEIKLIPKNTSPEDRWCVCMGACCCQLRVQTHRAQLQQERTDRAVVAVGVGC